MTTHDEKMVRKGRGEPLAAVAAQGRVSVALARQNEGGLAPYGWGAGKTDALEALVAQVDGRAGAQAEAKDRARTASAAETRAKSEAKTVVRKVRCAGELVLRDGPVDGVSLEALEAGGKLGASTPKISQYIAKILPSAAALDAQLAPYLGGAIASEMLATAKRNLDECDAAQETNLSALPDETAAVYEAKGRIVRMIEDLNRVAKIAFDGQAETLARFNKDILSRGRKTALGADAAGGASAVAVAK